MIYITGDTHGTRDIPRFSSPKFLQEINKPNNIVIVTGDFGVVWSNSTLFKSIEFYEQFKCKFLFIDGNNENFDMLNVYPISQEYGGNVQKIGKNITHLMRGEVYEIEGIKFLAFGGATSYDAPPLYPYTSRVEHKSWWKEETPNTKEFENALNNLKRHNNKVDIILTHETTSKNIHDYFNWSITSPTTKMLDKFDDLVDYKMWFFGHHHSDLQVSQFERCIYTDFIELKYVESLPYKSSCTPPCEINDD